MRLQCLLWFGACALLGLIEFQTDVSGAIFATSFSPTSGPVYEGSTVTIRLALATNSGGDFLGGSGTIYSDVSGTDTKPNSPASSVSISGITNDGYATFQYRDDGVANLSASGSGTETFYGYLYSYWVSTGWGNGYYQPVYGWRDQVAGFSAQSSFSVLNVAPDIVGMTTDVNVVVNESFSFGAIATDPGIFDVISYDWDLDGDGDYDDSTGANGDFAFTSAGVFQVGLRVSDGDGGFDYGAFTVNVADPVVAVPQVPEPSTLAIWCAGALGLTIARRRRTPKRFVHAGY